MNTRSLRAGLLPHRGLREFVRLAAEATGVGVAASVALLLAALLIASAADAATPETPSSGTLLLQGDGAPVAAPLLATDVAIDVSGVVARARVTQRFVNPSHDWREAVYVFPLPDDAAVDHLDVRVGTRRIVGVIRERGAARKVYEEAKQSGRKAALVDQERPNLFTTRVAAIGPGEAIEVAIEYQQTLRFVDGAFSLRFPLAITPRYIPGTPLAMPIAFDGWSPDTDVVDDASRITPPVVHPDYGKVNPVTLVGGHRRGGSPRQDRQPLPPGARDRSTRSSLHAGPRRAGARGPRLRDRVGARTGERARRGRVRRGARRPGLRTW